MSYPISVLVVEDSPLAQKVATIHMVNQGCKVDIAADSFTALEKAMTIRYDIILMDIGLGDGPDGFEVTNQIKQLSDLNKTTPIMAVTAHNEEGYQNKAIAYGMVGYFNKPFTAKEAEIVIKVWKKLCA
ncbi:Signal transduction histidine-protein kinase BarA [Legionella massiliensis]|uniref:Signal transduction histidine-protein kinase BarA n=2 Tax=Legionella massiliensis TaxID=1034943 RepID=A0A078KTU5_9GAMM|nr:Signal transduction histidine-protein kinase BarA [Legionella massiliensis]CEE12189.1 Signal transduction histidine-protein kinase BarA [Legionella massiliensis]